VDHASHDAADIASSVGNATDNAGNAGRRGNGDEADNALGTEGASAPEPGAARAADQASLGTLAARSFGWSVVGQLAQRGATWLSTIALVRILDSEDYGTYSIAVTVSMFLLALNDLAVGYAITRYQGDDVDELAATAGTVAIGLSASLYLVVFLAAPAIVGLFNPPAGSPAIGVVRLAAVAIVIDGTIAAPTGLITRALQERIRVSCELVGFVLSTTVVFGMAFAGAGAWSLAAGQVVGAAITASLLYVRAPVRARFRWDATRVPYLLRFGLPLMVAGAFNQLISNTDYVVVNRYQSLAVAGAYFVAFNVSNWPVTLINFAMRRTAMAAFSRLQGDATALQRAFERSIQLLVTATLPMAALICLQAREVMLFLFGPKWVAGTTALRFLAGISVVRLAFVLCLDLLAAKGRTMAILWVQAVWFVALVPGLWWGATRHGLVGVGVAQLAAAVFVALPLLSWCLAGEGVRIGPTLPLLVRPLLGAAALGLACLATRAPFHGALPRLAAGSPAGLTAYALVVLPGSPFGRQLQEVLGRRAATRVTRGRRPGGRPRRNRSDATGEHGR
jgi:PST family polysaccharide transporter